MPFLESLKEKLAFFRVVSPGNLRRLGAQRVSTLVANDAERAKKKLEDLTQRYPSAGPRELAQRFIDDKKTTASLVGGDVYKRQAPLMPGMRMSVTTALKGPCDFIFSRPSTPLLAVTTLNLRRRCSCRPSSTAGSSSTQRIRASGAEVLMRLPFQRRARRVPAR